MFNLRKIIKYILIILLFLSCYGDRNPNIPIEIIKCPGEYDGHLQGIAIDDKQNFIYWSFTKQIVKTDITGKISSKIDVPSHHGDLTFYDNKIYVAVNLGEFNLLNQGNSFVYVYDELLNKLQEFKLDDTIVKYGAGGIGYRNNSFFIIGGNTLNIGDIDYSKNFVYKYDEQFNYIKTKIINSGNTFKGIQSIYFFNGFWWLGCKRDKLIKTTESFDFIKKINFDAEVGISGKSWPYFYIGHRDENFRNSKGGIIVTKIE